MRCSTIQGSYVKKKIETFQEGSGEIDPSLLVEVLSDDHGSAEETISLDQLFGLVDEELLVRIGLRTIETVARAGGRVLWH